MHLKYFIILLSLSACSSVNEATISDEIVTHSINRITLESLAQDAVAAQRSLAKLRSATTPVRHETVNVTPPELERTVSTVFHEGPLKLIAEDLAREAGYHLVEFGTKRDVVVLVNWDQPISLIDAFLDLGVKAGAWADLEVDPNIGRVAIYYD